MKKNLLLAAVICTILLSCMPLASSMVIPLSEVVETGEDEGGDLPEIPETPDCENFDMLETMAEQQLGMAQTLLEELRTEMDALVASQDISSNALVVLYANATSKIEKAIEAMEAGKMGKAFGQTTAAMSIAKNALEKIAEYEALEEPEEPEEPEVPEEPEEIGESSSENGEDYADTSNGNTANNGKSDEAHEKDNGNTANNGKSDEAHKK